MDDMDRAQDNAQAILDQQVAAARGSTNQAPVADGFCHFCGKGLHLDGGLFCDSRCADSYDQLKHQASRA